MNLHRALPVFLLHPQQDFAAIANLPSCPVFPKPRKKTFAAPKHLSFALRRQGKERTRASEVLLPGSACNAIAPKTGRRLTLGSIKKWLFETMSCLPAFHSPSLNIVKGYPC